MSLALLLMSETDMKYILSLNKNEHIYKYNETGLIK